MCRVLKVLVACEESQTVCKAFRELGHEAYSCDIQPCSGGHPEWHIQDDVLKYLNKDWDLIVAHPPCTYLSNSGVCWLHKDINRWVSLFEGAEFFNKFLNLDCPHVAVENPIQHKYARALISKHTQTIQPWMFGHPESKATCLWLKNLPNLEETKNVKEEMMKLPITQRQRIHYLPPGPERSKLRSKTFEGIARAMAEQWSEYILNEELEIIDE